MLEWLKLLICLHLIVVVRGRDVQCDRVDYSKYCYDSLARQTKNCWKCQINEQHISEKDILSISGKLNNVYVEIVEFSSGSIKILPQMLRKSPGEEIFSSEIDWH